MVDDDTGRQVPLLISSVDDFEHHTRGSNQDECTLPANT